MHMLYLYFHNLYFFITFIRFKQHIDPFKGKKYRMQQVLWNCKNDHFSASFFFQGPPTVKLRLKGN